MNPATNPIVSSGADPWVILWEKAYYYCFVKGRRVCVTKAGAVADIGKETPATIWTAPDAGPYSKEVWAPELHRFGDRWYVYVAADDGENAHHRMYVLEGDAKDPQKPFRFAGKIAAKTDRWAIDGTVGVLNGHPYFVWSGWEGEANVRQDLYIAAMKDPLTLAGDRSCICVPEHPWELVGPPWAGKKDFPAGVAEGPQFLSRGRAVHLIYSANGSWTDDYCLGRLTFRGGDPLDPKSWRKHPEPVFASTDQVFGPGHASFVPSVVGKEDWIVYHAAKKKGSGWDRDVRAQKFGWAADGTPRFGKPLPPGVPIDTATDK
jgi:GH43 family beta-xylosidase